MKQLKNMTQKEKAACLFKLMPLEITPFIVYCRHLAGEIKDRKRTVHIKYLTDRLKGNDWQAVAGKVALLLATYEKDIVSDAGMFSELMFSEEIMPFTLYALQEFIESPHCGSVGFPLAAHLFLL